MIRKIILFILILNSCFTADCQNFWIEKFDSIGSLNDWKLTTNGNKILSNHYVFNNKSYSKSSQDSFLIVQDTSSNADFYFRLSKKIKALSGRNLFFHLKLLTKDTGYDLLFYGIKIIDKLGVNIYQYEYYTTSSHKFPDIIGKPGVMLPLNSDTIWQKADSMEFYFRFASNANNRLMDRQIIVDGISYDQLSNSITGTKKKSFKVFPNPTNQILNFIIDDFSQPSFIHVFNSIGVEILKFEDIKTSQFSINLKDLQKGVYYILLKSSKGLTGSKKIILN